MIKYNIFVLLILIMLPNISSAQKIKTIHGEYIYYAPNTITPNEAKKTAIFQAKLSALSNAFGTYIYQNNTTVIKNENKNSELNFQSLKESEIKGIWIKDTKKSEVEILGYEQNMLIVKAKVWGKAREIVKSPIKFSAKILRNGTTQKFESSQFKNKDDLYLYFKSATSGYLTIYLIDNLNKAYCLLPYKHDINKNVKIEQDKEYIFFSSQHTESAYKAIIDEYILTCTKEIEHNYIYIIFSPNEFTKSNDLKSKTTILPRELSFNKFQNWLSEIRIYDSEITIEKKDITISPL